MFLKVKGWKKIYQTNTNQKKARVAILITDKIDFKTRDIIKNKEVYFVMINASIHQEDIRNLNIYAVNNRTSKYIKQKLVEMKEIHNYSWRYQHFFFFLFVCNTSIYLFSFLKIILQYYINFRCTT